MQLVGQGLNAGGDGRGFCLQFADSTADFGWQIKGRLLELREFIGQHRETLPDVVVKLSGNPSPLLILRINQLAAHACEDFFRSFALGHVDADTDVTHEGMILVVPGDSNVDDPPVFSVVPTEAILHSELLTTIKGLNIGTHASLQVVRVNSLRPTVAELGV